ncbi:MAG: tRNA modification GTPase [Planctomycetota bacterium]|jgi:tRNA modification GTPase
MTQTIAAICSAPGPGVRGAIRVSGSLSSDLIRRVLGTSFEAGRLKRRGCFRGQYFDGVGSQPVLVLWMPGPRSFTREDVVEFHLPGSPPLLSRALERLFEVGAVAAQPGEFTRRAFENGRIDLTQAEGVLELVEASNESERRAAVALLSGGLSSRLTPLRDTLDDLRALCEASLDFDSDETGAVPEAELLERFDRADAGLTEALQWELARVNGIGSPRLVFAGAPNAGKSSLFNRLTAEGRALVTPHSGTTRDVLEAVWGVCGVECELVDAPGLEEIVSGPDARAQEMSRDRRDAADLLMWVVDATRTDVDSLLDEVRQLQSSVPILLVWNQIDRDLAKGEPPLDLQVFSKAWCAVSAESGAGLADLEQAAGELLGLAGVEDFSSDSGGVRELSIRHRANLELAQSELAQAREALHSGSPLDWIAETLRAATAALDGISGSTTAEDVLTRIFSRFCLGK